MALWVGFFLISIIFALLKSQGNSKKNANWNNWGIGNKAILTNNEKEFFQRLLRALPDYHVFPQVAANALLKVVNSKTGSEYHSTRGRFAQKHVDFVICARDSLEVVAIIELDDRTHNADKDRKRDAMFEQAGYRVIRFQSKRKPSEAEILAVVLNMPNTLVIDSIPQKTEPELTAVAPASKEDSNW